MNGEPFEVVIFGREGCHLCDVVEAEIQSMKEIKTRLTVVDIDRSPKLHDRYWMRIPVVTVGGEEVFEAKMMDMEGKWKKLLPSLLKRP